MSFLRKQIQPTFTSSRAITYYSGVMGISRPAYQTVQRVAEGASMLPEEELPVQRVGEGASMLPEEELPVQRKANNTGLPDQLKTGIEHLSGYAMDDVKVHYNSNKPAQMQALAYAQGTDIHVASGQERHLPHEAWHVVQQKQGRVQATMQLKGAVNINDDKGLEREADVMGARALQLYSVPRVTRQLKKVAGGSGLTQRVEGLATDRLNVVGEDHNESNDRRNEEREACRLLVGGGYWTEPDFNVQVGNQQVSADPEELRFKAGLHTIYRVTNGFAGVRTPEGPMNLAAQTLALLTPTFTMLDGYYRSAHAVAYPGNLNGVVLQARNTDLALRNSYVLAMRDQLLALAAMSEEGKAKIAEKNGDSKVDDSEAGRAARIAAIRLKKNKIKGHHDAFVLARNELLVDLPTVRELDNSRSSYMHAAAQQKVATIGVWKIGQDHVVDIRRDFTGAVAPRYHLLSQDEYNHTLEYPTPAEAKKLGVNK